MTPNTKKIWKFVLGLLFLIFCSVWLAVIVYPQPSLKIIACDVGQGDASLIVYKSTQILIDGGPDRKVIACLDNNMPFWDRTIELVILTHPQKDHFGGLLDVFESFNVHYFMATRLGASSQEYHLLENIVGRGVSRLLIRLRLKICDLV